jgi:hypothetical protein
MYHYDIHHEDDYYGDYDPEDLPHDDLVDHDYPYHHYDVVHHDYSKNIDFHSRGARRSSRRNSPSRRSYSRSPSRGRAHGGFYDGARYYGGRRGFYGGLGYPSLPLGLVWAPIALSGYYNNQPIYVWNTVPEDEAGQYFEEGDAPTQMSDVQLQYLQGDITSDIPPQDLFGSDALQLMNQ